MNFRKITALLLTALLCLSLVSCIGRGDLIINEPDNTNESQEETDAKETERSDAEENVFAKTKGRWYLDRDEYAASIYMDGCGNFVTYYASGAKEFEGYLKYVDEYGDGNGRYDMCHYDETEPYLSFYFHAENELHMGNGEGPVYIRID